MSSRVAAEFRDPIHGYIYVDEDEKEMIDNPLFQRLRRIRQLSGAHITYPGAQHTRFDHLIGSMHLAKLAAARLTAEIGMNPQQVKEIKIAALLHDIGHGPFSHLFEEVLAERRNISHEDLTKRVIQETEIKDILQKHGYRTDIIPDLAIGLSQDRPLYMNELVGGGLSVDIMDYLLRDSYFTGVEYGQVDIHRIINSFDIVDKHLALDQAALYAFEALMIARYEMFRAVYFHRTVRAAEIMLIRAITLADEALNLTDVSDLSRYLSLTDETTLALLTDLNPEGRSNLDEAKQIALDYRDRRLIKCVFEKFVQRRNTFMEKIFGQKKIREQIGEEIAGKAGVDPEKVYVDVPTTPSVPFTSSRRALKTLTLISKTGDRIRYQTIDVADLPLMGAISGYMDILRVYTVKKYRDAVQKATAGVLGEEGDEPWWNRVSM
ncbi:MAG: HD domain-containing protein [Nitrososphaerales archaeon]